MRADVITVIWILTTCFLCGGWFGWYLGRKFEQQRRIASILRARLLLYRLYSGGDQARTPACKRGSLMRATCPDCGTQGHVAAFLVEDEGKRLAATLAGMVPELGRATIGYLSLFKPAKTALRLARAAKLAQELDALAALGSVCRDERSGVHRPCTPAIWAAGIEQMLAQRGALSLPLDSHNYLRAVVFGLADKADAAVERQVEANARVGKHLITPSAKAAPVESRLDNQLNWIAQQVSVGAMEQPEAERLRIEARAKYGVTA